MITTTILTLNSINVYNNGAATTAVITKLNWDSSWTTIGSITIPIGSVTPTNTIITFDTDGFYRIVIGAVDITFSCFYNLTNYVSGLVKDLLLNPNIKQYPKGYDLMMITLLGNLVLGNALYNNATYVSQSLSNYVTLAKAYLQVSKYFDSKENTVQSSLPTTII